MGIFILGFIGCGLFLLSSLIATGTIIINDVTMMGYSIAGFMFTLGFFIKSLIPAATKSKSQNNVSNIISSTFFIIASVLIVFSTYLEQLPFFRNMENTSLVSNYITLATIALILIELAIKDYLKEKEKDKKTVTN